MFDSLKCQCVLQLLIMFPFITALVPHWFYHVCFGLKSASPTKVIRLSGGILICWHPRIQASSYFYINWHKEGKNPLEMGILQRVNKKDRKANHNCVCHFALDKNYLINAYVHTSTQAFSLMHNCPVISGPVSPQDHLPSREIRTCTWKWSEPQTLPNGLWLRLAITEDLGPHQSQTEVGIGSTVIWESMDGLHTLPGGGNY